MHSWTVFGESEPKWELRLHKTKLVYFFLMMFTEINFVP
jgi:hypothetical protein